MRVLFVSKKRDSDLGGLSRFAKEISKNFPSSYLLSPSNLKLFLRLPFLKIDHIHLCDFTLLPAGLFLKFILRKPLTVTGQGLDIIFNNPLYRTVVKICLNKVNGIVTSSYVTKGLVKSLYQKKAQVIYQGVSIDHLNKSSSILLPDLKGKLVLTSVANLVPRKGHVWFIENVMSKLPKQYLYLIIGDGPTKQKIQQTISKYKLEKRVVLLGQLNDAQLSFVLKKSDIFVCTNQKIKDDVEGLGMAWAEAALLGLPVIASKVDGIPEVIRQGKNGLLVKPHPQAFIKAINSLKDYQSRKNLGLRAISYTRNYYSWQKTSQNYLKVFKQL